MKIKRELFMFVKKFEAGKLFLTIKFGNVGSGFGVKHFISYILEHVSCMHVAVPFI
jgi:hypothetical protein